MKQPIRVAVTGAAGQICYNLLFRIASGEMLGKNQPVILQLLEVESAMNTLAGVIMELEDCAFPLLHGIIASHDPLITFKDADVALLVGARPRSKGMERSDLLELNGAIFITQGKALAQVANKEVKVLVVGNPANTNALILANSAKGLNPKNITAMMRLDHNRALNQLATKLKLTTTAIKQVIVWGNHSSTQYPDIYHAQAGNKLISELVDETWLSNTFIPTIQKRGAAIIEARGLSSAASAASAAIDHMRNWVLGSNGEIVSMAVASDGSYGIAPGLIFGFPCICQNGQYSIVTDLKINQFSRTRIDLTHQELCEEREAIKHLL